nr:integrin beta-like protein 1 isoform X1 [Crassostrea gigas]
MLNSVLFLVLLAGMSILEVAGFIFLGCYSDNDCRCGIGKTPYCSLGSCHCREHSGCHKHSDCHSHHCTTSQRPFCSQEQCHCRECNENSQCGHQCGINQRPHCSDDGHCHCVECLNHTECSQHCNAYQSFYCSLGSCHCGDIDCEHNSECNHHCRTSERSTCLHGRCSCIDSGCIDIDCSHHCNAYQPFYCALGSCHCGDIDCQHNSDCNHHCRASEKSMCLHGTCSCKETTTTTTSTPTTTTTEASTTTREFTTVDSQVLLKCRTHTECSSHVCPAGKHPYCSFRQRSTDCQCTVCTDDSHCFCPSGLVGKCYFNIFDRSYSCVCGIAMETTAIVLTTKTTTTTATHQTSGKPCPFCDTDLNCVWNQTCSDSETCMVRAVLEQGFKFSVHCIMSSDCQLMSTKFGEIFCCDDRGCLERYLPGV